MSLCKVIVLNNSQCFSNLIDDSLTYNIPETYIEDVSSGSFVYVPIRDKVHTALVIETGLHEVVKFKVKDILEVLDPDLKVDQEIIDIVKFCSHYYCAKYSETIETVISASLIPKIEKEIQLKINADELENEITNSTNEKTKLVLKTLGKCRSQKAKFSHLRNLCKITSKLLNNELSKLKNKKLIEVTYLYQEFNKNKVSSDHLDKFESEISDLNKLSEQQENAYRQISNSPDEVIRFLIHGVTGSGKTEVYFHLIQDCLNNAKSAIILVPEIALAPQLIERLKANFPKDKIIVWHSALDIKERQHSFYKLLQNENKIIVGARSAIFCPVKNLGLIVIDEEHENSYKQDQPAPRYHTRKIAEFRAKKNKAKLVYGSATPNLETYYKALSEKHKDIQLITLKSRFNQNPLPKVDIVDMREEYKLGNKSIFSKQLKELLETKLKKKEQSILFLNKRGNSSHVFCRDCGYIYKCRFCDSKMVYHSDKKRLICHLCGNNEEHPDHCPACNSQAIKYFGLGTQKLEEEAKKAFPEARVKRLDSDVNKNKKTYLEIWSDFKNHKIDILIGTQMIAKGLDNPNLTCVGVVAADSSFSQLDYQADEKGFQLLTQVSGRAGRKDKEGSVIFQSYQTEREALIDAQSQDYIKFYENEIQNREDFSYPPFAKLIRFIASSENEVEAINSLNIVHEELTAINEATEEKIQILGPSQCQINRINNQFRYHILVKLKEENELNQNKIKDVFLKHRKASKARLIIDIDSVSLY
ncbi:MAG: primosomal protein N' [Candidatus Caenarcaniphilales bacterium]|nr:primosomal protein N' [Candidatus Caenarcaniphilales bacterium]